VSVAAAEGDSRDADGEVGEAPEAAREAAAAEDHSTVPPLTNGARHAVGAPNHGAHGDGDDNESGSGSSSSSDIDDLDRASSFSSCDDDDNDDEGLPGDATTAADALQRRRGHHLRTASMGSGGSGVSLADLCANPALGAAATDLRSMSSQLSSGGSNGAIPPLTAPARGGLRTQSAGGASSGKAALPPTHWAVERVAAGIAAESQQHQQRQPGTPQTRALSPATPSPQPPRPAQVGCLQQGSRPDLHQ